MSGIDLKAINGTFLKGLVAYSSSSGDSSSISQAASSSSGAVDISLSLRIGAQTFAKAIGSLNSVANVVNLAEGTLNALGEVVDKMILLAERAAKSTTGSTQRSDLDRQFKKLSNEFRKVVDASEVDDQNILTREGLIEIFKLVGLDEENSESIADVFEKFVTPKEDSALASEETKAPRPVVVPRGAYPTAGGTSIGQEKITDNQSGAQITTGIISSVNSVFQDDDNINNQNPTNLQTVGMVGLNGDLLSLPAGNTENATVLNVSETSGYTIISSSEDFLGYNAGGYEQLYMVDTTGAVVHQYTMNSTSDTFQSADIDADGKAISYVQVGGGNNTFTTIIVPTLGGDPADSASYVLGATVPTGVYTYSDARISENGAAAALDINGSGLNNVVITPATFLAGDLILTTGDFESFGFLDTTTLALVQNDGAGNMTLHTYTYGSGGITVNEGALNSGPTEVVSNFVVSELGSSDAQIAFYVDSGGGLGEIRATDSSLSTDPLVVRSIDTAGGESLTRLSISGNSSGGNRLRCFWGPQRRHR